eukprot:scaffold608_cov282-Ochromonas_danica.AAC.1
MRCDETRCSRSDDKTVDAHGHCPALPCCWMDNITLLFYTPIQLNEVHLKLDLIDLTRYYYYPAAGTASKHEINRRVVRTTTTDSEESSNKWFWRRSDINATEGGVVDSSRYCSTISSNNNNNKAQQSSSLKSSPSLNFKRIANKNTEP